MERPSYFSTCFISYGGQDKELARELARYLEAAGVEVFKYDPDELWADPATNVIEAIEEVDHVVYLERQVASPWIEAELLWAARLGVGVEALRSVGDLDRLLARLTRPREEYHPLRRGDRYLDLMNIYQPRIRDGPYDVFSAEHLAREELQIRWCLQDIFQARAVARGYARRRRWLIGILGVASAGNATAAVWWPWAWAIAGLLAVLMVAASRWISRNIALIERQANGEWDRLFSPEREADALAHFPRERWEKPSFTSNIDMVSSDSALDRLRLHAARRNRLDGVSAL